MNTTEWEFVISRKMGLFETWCSGEAYRSLPLDSRMDNVIVSRDGIIRRYNSRAHLQELERKIQTNDVVPILNELAKYDDQLAEVVKKDPITHRAEFLDAVYKTWIYEVFGWYVGAYSKDAKAIELVEKLRGIHNAQHIAATDFVPKLLEQISVEKNISTELLKYATPQEVLDLTFDTRALESRQKLYVLELKNNQMALYTDDAAAKKVSELLLPEDPEEVEVTDHVTGNVAYKGSASGKVVIVNDEQDLKKLQEGDILVSIMTRTTLVSGMKKAAAIVTDEGGMTCHAAIIARELRKPCVVGTKIATKVFKDGDMVEVDAENGVIRKT